MLRTIRAKITVFTILICVLFAASMGAVFYNNFRQLLIDNMVAVSNANLRLVMDTLDEDIRSAQAIAEWSTINSDLSGLLLIEGNGPARKREMLRYLNELRSVVSSSPVGESILKIIILGGNGLEMQIGSVYGHNTDAAVCEQSEWFARLLENESIIWPGIEKTPFRYGNGYMVPIVRPVYSHLRHTNVGWFLLAVDGWLLMDYLGRYASYEDSEVIIFTPQGQVLAHKNPELVGTVLEDVPAVLARAEDSSEREAACYRSDVTGWYIMQTLSATEIEEQQRVFFNVISATVLALIALGVLLSAFLGGRISRPIRRINLKVRQIAGGDFTRAEDIESEDEIGEIGKDINGMTADIRERMEQAVRDEKAKRGLELRVLQTQVNPHFLYNTLNSIKWIATMQKNTGIGEMVTALSRLLRNMAKGVSAEIPLREELSLVEDYALIQQFRYSGKFSVKYEVDEDTLDCRIIKFTLQPLVENAIFHGIAPKNKPGTVTIYASKTENRINIRVCDDGVGISHDKIGDILTATAVHAKDSLNSIGLANVNERIKLTYGDEYGLTVQSKPEQGTKIKITIPIKEKPDV